MNSETSRETEDEEREVLHKASRARTILDDPIIVEAFLEIREKFLHQLEFALVGEEIMAARYMLTAMHNFERQLTSFVEAGKIVTAGFEQREYSPATFNEGGEN